MRKLKASIFNLSDLEITSPSKDQMEEIVHYYARVMYQIGRFETDEKQSGKEYDKLLKEKEKLVNKIDEFFKN